MAWISSSLTPCNERQNSWTHTHIHPHTGNKRNKSSNMQAHERPHPHDPDLQDIRWEKRSLIHQIHQTDTLRGNSRTAESHNMPRQKYLQKKFKMIEARIERVGAFSHDFIPPAACAVQAGQDQRRFDQDHRSYCSCNENGPYTKSTPHTNADTGHF